MFAVPGASADDANFPRSFLAAHCVRCHGETKPKARIRLDTIDAYRASDASLWTLVHEALVTGEMPPEDEPRPQEAERQLLLEWIRERVRAETAGSHSPLRRLNRREFSAALRDLTGVAIDFGAALPADGEVDGFDTGAEALQDAADSVAGWLEITRRAVESIRVLEPDRERRIFIDFREHEFTDFRKWVDQRFQDRGIFTRSKSLRCRPGVGLFLATQWMGDRSNSFLAVPAPTDRRAALKLTLRVVARRPFPGLPVPTLAVEIGGQDIDHVSVSDEPRTLSFAVRMEDHLVEGGVIKIQLRSLVEVPYAVEGFENDDRTKPEDAIPGGIGVYRPSFDRKTLRTPEEQPVPSIVVESIEIDFDHCAPWPPASWDMETGGDVETGAIEDSEECARRLLTLWIDRAWRRPASVSEVQPFHALYRQLRVDGFTFDAALRAAFQSVLMGGPFRYLASPSDADPVLAQHAIASRLSFFLAGTPPDRELRRLARAGRLRDPDVLDAQVDRLVGETSSDGFFRPFVMQWLHLEQPITLTMSHLKKQDFRFGRHLKASMKEETIQYIATLFRENRPARELISSDWTMMNDILANYHGVDALEGGELRKVPFAPRPEDPRGGGVLGHAGIQSMLCWMGDNWVIYRGAWTLRHILDDPPPPPPLEVPELNPADEEHRGKSARELLLAHQADERCSTCHQKMDPLGFAFQNFDLSGRWRDVEYTRYRRHELDGKIEWRGEGETRPVDAAGRLPRGEEFASFLELKELLVTRYLEDIVRGLLKKLVLHGTGRKASVLDFEVIRRILKEHASRGYPLRDLLKALVRSPIFLETMTRPEAGAQEAGTDR